MKRRVKLYKKQQGGEQEFSQEQLIQHIAQQIEEGVPAEAIKDSLGTDTGIDQNTIDELVDGIAGQYAEQTYQEPVQEETPVGEEEEEQDMLALYDTDFSMEDEEEDPMVEEALYMRYGGSKKKFEKLIRKQLGGAQPTNTDIPDGRESIIPNFVNKLQTEATVGFLKENLFPFIQPVDGLEEAQRGREMRQMKRLMRRMPKFIPMGMPGIPSGPIQSIDVNRTGIFGRPKDYTINFGAVPDFTGQFPMQQTGQPRIFTGTKKTVFSDNEETYERPPVITTKEEVVTEEEPKEETVVENTNTNQNTSSKKSNQTKPRTNTNTNNTQTSTQNTAKLPWLDPNTYKQQKPTYIPKLSSAGNKRKGNFKKSRDLTPDERNAATLENIKASFTKYGYKDGGDINLSKFIYGGDDPSIPELTQAQDGMQQNYNQLLQMMMMQQNPIMMRQPNYGGGFALPGFNPAFPVLGYMPTGNNINPFISNGIIDNVHVKNNLFGRPKKYTIDYLVPKGTTPGSKPTPTITTKPTQGSQSGMDERMNRTFGENLGHSLIGTGNEFLGKIGSKFIPFGNTDASTQANTEKVKKVAGMFTGQSRPNMSSVDAEQFKKVVSNQTGLPDYNPFYPKAQRGISTQAEDGMIPVDMNNVQNVSTWQSDTDFFDTNPEQSINVPYGEPDTYMELNTPEQEYETVSQDYKLKRGFDGESFVNQFNVVANAALGVFDRAQMNRQEQELAKRLNADQLYASRSSRDLGNYDTNAYDFRRPQAGFTGVAQMGGQKEGDVVYMTEEELNQFLQSGGEVEYLQ